jgi:hypothetical protein
MTQRVKSSDMMLKKSFSRTLMSRGHLHSPAKDPAQTVKEENGIFDRFFCFDGNDVLSEGSSVVISHSSLVYERKETFKTCFMS